MELRRGETVGIVGESGSGKSTVARCVSRLIDLTDGKIWLGREEIGHMSRGALRDKRRRIQIVFQDPYRSLNPRRTVGQSIVEGPMYFGTSQADAAERARRLMTLVRLDPAALDRYPHEFSGGQRQRICIARALAMEPEVLIADEAVSALDVSVQKQVLELLDDIRVRLDLAVLFITHDLRVAAQICDRVGVMSQGRLVEYGTAAEVLGAPKHEYTRTLLAAAPRAGSLLAEEASVPPPQASRERTSLKSSCDALKCSSRVPTLEPMPELSFFLNCLMVSVRPWPSLPRPWPVCQPMPWSNFIPTLSFSSSQNDWPCRLALP
jgi:peptide/nickel transport system ATP-binding protein